MTSIQQSDSVFTSSDNTLIRYVEVWTSGDDGSRLVLESARTVGNYSAHRDSDVTSVAIGEGLVGQAWQEKTSVICHDRSRFGLQSCEEPDLACMVVIPVFRQQEIRGVVILGLSDGFGAAEIWSRDDRDELSVTSGHYAGLPSFEFITAYTRFPKGAGLPGNVWKTGQPIIAQNLDQSSAFIRSFGNDPAVVTSAIGIPVCSSRGFPASVLLLLEAGDCPLAGRTELWMCCDKEPFDRGSAITHVSTTVGQQSKLVAQWQQTLMFQVIESGAPVLAESANGCLPTGAGCVVAMPVFHNSAIAGVLALTF